MIRKLDPAITVITMAVLPFILTANTVVAHEGEEHGEGSGFQYTSELLTAAGAVMVVAGLSYWLFNHSGDPS